MKDVFGYIRVILPRYREAGQREAMAKHEIERVIVEGAKKSVGTRADLFRMVRNGTVVAIQHLFLLSDPKKVRARGGSRADLWKAIDEVERRGGTFWELYTGLRSDTKDGRDEMFRSAIEALAKGRHKRSASDKRGRPAKEFTPAELQQARDAWHNRKLATWADVKEKLPKGFSLARAHKLWGPRE